LTPSRGVSEMDSSTWASFMESHFSPVEEGQVAFLTRVQK
jgi:hypothetical protein